MASYLIAANYHSVQLSEDWEESRKTYGLKSAPEFPKNVVLGFRAIFWEAFTGVHHRPAAGVLTLLGKTWRLSQMAVLKSTGAGGRLGMPDDDNVVILAMLIESDEVEKNYNLNKALSDADMNEQKFVAEIVKGLADDAGLEWLATLRHERDFPGRYILPYKPDYGRSVEMLALYGFHYFGQLLFWQISRDQVNIELSDDLFEIERNGADLLSLRKRIINMDRLFLTSSISNHAALRALSKDCKAQQRIQERFERLPELNERIEKYFEIVTQLAVQRDQRFLNAIVSIIAILGLPVSLISMMLAMSTTAQIITKPLDVFGVSGGFVAFPWPVRWERFPCWPPC